MNTDYEELPPDAFGSGRECSLEAYENTKPFRVALKRKMLLLMLDRGPVIVEELETYFAIEYGNVVNFRSTISVRSRELRIAKLIYKRGTRLTSTGSPAFIHYVNKKRLFELTGLKDMRAAVLALEAKYLGNGAKVKKKVYGLLSAREELLKAHLKSGAEVSQFVTELEEGSTWVLTGHIERSVKER